MENMTLQTTKIKNLEAEINNLKDLKKISDNAHEIEIQRAQKQIEKLIKAESEDSIGQTIGQAKEIIWTSIVDSMNEIWPSIQIIFYQRDLIGLVSDAIDKTNRELIDMPETTNNIIKFLNSKNKF